MSVLNKLKADVLEARKSRSPDAIKLQTLLAEAEAVAKNEMRDVTDADVYKTTEKFIKGVDKNVEADPNGPHVHNFLVERTMYMEYAEPDPFSGMSVEQVIVALKATGQPVNIGTVMKAGKGRFNVNDVKAAL